jgi:hypothetical protein
MTAEQQSAPPPELMQNPMYSITSFIARPVVPSNVDAEMLARHMRGENVPICSATRINAKLREAALRRDNFGSRTVQLLNPVERPPPCDNPPHPSWWGSTTNGLEQQQVERHT